MPDTPLDTNPVIVLVGGFIGLVNLGLVAAAATDLIDLTPEQTASIVALITGAGALVTGFLRSIVWAPATVREAGIPDA